MMTDDEIQKIWAKLAQSFNSERAKGVNTRVQFDIEGGDSYYLEIKNQQLTAGKGQILNPRLTIGTNAVDLASILNGTLDPGKAFFQGRLHVKGDIQMAMQLAEFFK